MRFLSRSIREDIQEIHCSCCLSYDGSTVSSTASSPQRASSFTLQYYLLSLGSTISRLRLLPPLPVISIIPYIFLSLACFRRHCDQSS